MTKELIIETRFVKPSSSPPHLDFNQGEIVERFYKESPDSITFLISPNPGDRYLGLPIKYVIKQ